MKNKFFVILLVLLIPSVALGYNYWLKLLALKAVYEIGEHPLDVITGDISGDRDPDIITANREGRSLSVLLGNGDGTLTQLDDIKLKKAATSLAIGDLDGDGHNDLVVSVCGNHCQENALLLLQGSSDSRFEKVKVIEVAGVPYNLQIGDFNGDQILDFAASDYPRDKILVFLQRQNWQFDEIELSTDDAPIALEVADLNNDGISDLVSSNHRGGNSTVYLGDREEKFLSTKIIETGKLPYSIALEDINHDNRIDMVVAHSDEPGQVSVMIGDGQGGFFKRDSFKVKDRLIFVAIADFDLDSYPDIITTQHEEQRAYIYLNNQEGSFVSEAIPVVANNKIYSLAIDYFNHDEFPDLVTVDYTANTLSISHGHEPREDAEQLLHLSGSLNESLQ